MDRTRHALAAMIAARLEPATEQLASQWNLPGVHHFVCDDLLSPEIVRQIHAAFPDPSTMMLKKSLKELKYVGVQMDKYASVLEEITYAFQDSRVVDAIGRITGIKELSPDENLYAGGVSLMGHGHFLNPHLDNSHDYARRRYRAINLLYY